MRHACAFAVALLAGLAPAARAAYIPWKYNWTRSPDIVYSDNSQTSYITLTDEKLLTAAGSSDIVATNLKVFSDAHPDTPAPFTDKVYTLTLFLLDVRSNQSGTLNFTGLLNGTVSSLSSNLKNQFTGLIHQQLPLGRHLYDVTIGPFTPPGPPGSSNSGAISAHAMVTVSEIHKTPEPSSLLLALLGIPLVGYRAWRRRAKPQPGSQATA